MIPSFVCWLWRQKHKCRRPEILSETLASSVAVGNSSRIEVSIRAHLLFLMEFDTAIKGPEELSLSYR